MAAIISYLCEKENKKLQGWPNRIADKVFGKPRKVFILTGTRSYFDPKPGTCWWFMSHLPTGEKELFLKEAGKFTLGWVGGLASPFLGLELPSVGKDTAEAVSPQGGLMKEAVDTAVWQLVKKTDNAWVIAIKDCFLGACAAFEKNGHDYKIWLNALGTVGGASAEHRMMTRLEQVEAHSTGDDLTGGVNATRERAKRGTCFSITEGGEIRKLG